MGVTGSSLMPQTSEALMESMKGVWNGDVDLGNGK